MLDETVEDCVQFVRGVSFASAGDDLMDPAFAARADRIRVAHPAVTEYSDGEITPGRLEACLTNESCLNDYAGSRLTSVPQESRSRLRGFSNS